MNALRVIHPYWHEGTWVFDDRDAGLVREPFVSGADAIIDRMVESIPDARSGFTLVFSADPFPGYQARFERTRAEYNGTWYFSADLGMEGWLCPALLKYFPEPPPMLYAQFKAKRA